MTQSSCIRTHPNPIPDASQNTSKGFSISGFAKIGAVVSKSVKCERWLHTPESKQISHPSVVTSSLA